MDNRENTFYGNFTQQETAALNEVYGQWIFWKVVQNEDDKEKVGYYAWCYEWPKDLRIVDRHFVSFRNKVMKEGDDIRGEIDAIEDDEEVEVDEEKIREQVKQDIVDIRNEFNEKGIVDESRNIEKYVPADDETDDSEFEETLDEMDEEIEFKMSAVPFGWDGEPIQSATEFIPESESTDTQDDESAPKFKYDASTTREENIARYLEHTTKRRF